MRASPLVIIIILLFKRDFHSRKNRRFQLRSLHTTHAFPCTPITKDAKTYVLQDCLGDLVLFFHICCGFGLPVPLFLLYRVVRQSCWVHKRAPHWVRASPLVIIIILLFKRTFHSRKNRRFQLRSLHTTHAFPCTPITKDAKTYVLQDCLGDLVLFFHICCGFGLPVPLFLLYRVVRQSCWVHKRAPHWVRASPLVIIIILLFKRTFHSRKNRRFQLRSLNRRTPSPAPL